MKAQQHTLAICSIAVLAVVSLVYAASPDPALRPWINSSAPPLTRAQLFVYAMTLDEKIEQIHKADVKDRPREIPGIERLRIKTFKITNGPAGAGPGDSHVAVPATALPSALALSATWDPKLATTFGEILGRETADRGEQLIEDPGAEIVRISQNGRNLEYFGEDPYLSGALAIAEIRAIQQQGVIAEVKYYAANNQETDRKSVNEIIDERALREIYLPAFEEVVKQGRVGAVMCAYPSVNGQFGCENLHLLKDFLREESGFKRFVQSDYTATHSTIAAAKAGFDLEMKHDNLYDAGMKDAVATGKLPEAVVDTMLVRRNSQMFQVGTFDTSYAVTPIPADRDGAVARSIAEQGAVLLKNDNHLLPFNAKQLYRIVVIGPYARTAHTGGGGSSYVTALYTVDPVEGIAKVVGPDITVTYADWANPVVAATKAAFVDIAIVMVGDMDSEARDRPNLSLPDKQDDLISTVAAANPRAIVVLKTGGPVLMPWLGKVPAMLEAWYPGKEDGTVVADLVFGKANPSDTPTVIFPRSAADVPAYTSQQYPGVGGTVVYSEGLQVGYRWYDARRIEPLVFFGFGLSYTCFSFGDLHVSSQDAEGSVHVTLAVTNTGSPAGADVVELYVAAPATAGEPPRQLKGFAKVHLVSGESTRVSLVLSPRAFSIWNVAAKRWSIVVGNHEIFVGDSSRDLPLHAEVVIQ